MRVLFLLRSDARRLTSGPAEQVRHYARAVTEHGGEAVVHLGPDRPRGHFDVAHVLDVDWPLESARQMDIAIGSAPRFVLSPIHHDRAWEDHYHAAGRAGASARVANCVGLDGFLRLRGMVQAGNRPRLWGEAARQAVFGVRQRQLDMLERSDTWLVASDRETASIAADFGVAPRPTRIVRNGANWVDDDVAPPPGEAAEFVLSVGRIEARKNQLGLARALAELDVPGVFVGQPNPRHRAYVRAFAEYVAGQPSLTWLRSIGREATLAMYRRARLHVLASWYEVSALVDAEAAVAGCPMVTTQRGYSGDVLGDAALYWDPASAHQGLVAIVRKGLERRRDPGAAARFRELLSWERIGQDVVRAYA